MHKQENTSEYILNIDHVSKTFGNKQVLRDVSMSVKEGSIFGFIGQNGAGKTTTMKIILGLLKYDTGLVEVCGKKVTYGQNQTNQYIGYLPDVPEYYSYMNAREYLKLCGEITGMKKSDLGNKMEELLDLVGLTTCKSRIGTYSRGMRQRLGIAQALLNNPRLLICDEPTSALDPIGRKEILDILKKSGTTVVLSTHILTDVERICDNVAFLNQGEIVLRGSIDDMKRKYPNNTVLVEFTTPEEKNRFKTTVMKNFNLNPSNETELEITFEMNCTDQNINQILQQIVEQGILIRKFEKLDPSLENIFMEVVG